MRRMRLEWRQSADLLGEHHGFNSRCQSKLGCQHSSACFIGIQCGAALIRARKYPHQLTVGGFAQWIDFKKMTYGAFGFRQLSGAFVKRS